LVFGAVLAAAKVPQVLASYRVRAAYPGTASKRRPAMVDDGRSESFRALN
jgi:hypothetical protein